MIGLIVFDFGDEALVDVPAQKNLNRYALISALALRDFSAGKNPRSESSSPARFHISTRQFDFTTCWERTTCTSLGPGHIAESLGKPMGLRLFAGQGAARLDYHELSYFKQTPSLRETGFREAYDYYQDLYNHAQFAALYLDNQFPLRFDGEDVSIYEAYARKGGVFDTATPPVRISHLSR